MRKCKMKGCNIDISSRGNRSQYCKKHSKEIRNEKVKVNKKTHYRRYHPKSNFQRTYKPRMGGKPLSNADDVVNPNSKGGVGASKHLRPVATPSKRLINKQYGTIPDPSTSNPLREYYFLYEKQMLSKSDYDKERYRQKKIRELHEKQEANIKHKWKNRKPHPEFWRKQVDIINNPKFKDKRKRDKYAKERDEFAKNSKVKKFNP